MYSELEKGLGYVFRDKKLLENALSHSSYANEKRDGRTSNERLEFLGDSILGFVTADFLYRNFPERPCMGKPLLENPITVRSLLFGTASTTARSRPVGILDQPHPLRRNGRSG